MDKSWISKCFCLYFALEQYIFKKMDLVLFVCRGYTCTFLICVVKLSDISDDYFEITCVVIHVCYNLQLNDYQKREDKMLLIDCFSLLDFFLGFILFFGGGVVFFCLFFTVIQNLDFNKSNKRTK